MAQSLEIPALLEDGNFDADTIACHAVFTCLVNFVEKEHGSLADEDGGRGFREYVRWCQEEDCNNPKAQVKTLELYELYTEKEGPSPQDRLVDAVGVMGCWWT